MKKIFILFAAVTLLSGCTLIEQNRAGIQIKSETPATVTINGEEKGETPVTIEDLKPGEYAIKLENSDGSWEKSVRIENGTLFYINYALAATEELQEGEMIYLERGRGVGVISTPGQAEVTLDGEKQGFTPYLIQNITEGEHEIILTKDGYKSRAIKINGVKDHKIMVEAKLKSLSATGSSDSSTENSPSPSASTSASGSPSASTRASASASARASASVRPSTSPSSRTSPSPSPRASTSASPRPTSSSTEAKGTITVLETSTGWLRVRDKAGLEGKEITTINTGETYDYIEQTDNGWTQIVLKDGQVGFVASRFVKVNN